MEEAERLWSAEFSALTTNNTLLNKEIQKGIYDEWIPLAAAAAEKDQPGLDDTDRVLEVAFALNARHGLRLVQQVEALRGRDVGDGRVVEPRGERRRWILRRGSPRAGFARRTP